MGRTNQGSNTPVEWLQLTEEEKLGFTMGHTIEKIDWFSAHDAAKGNPAFYNRQVVTDLMYDVFLKRVKYYGETDLFLYECLEKHPIQFKSVAVIGSVQPWYEAICLAYGAEPFTIEYNKIETNDPRLTLMTVDEYRDSPIKFDAALSISSFEHDGLGRYGDPIDPEGDIKAMQNIRENVLKDGGLLYLSVPVGKDKICWNVHRIYGPKRWSKLIEGYEIIYSVGLTEETIEHDTGKECFQPVVVLRKKS